MALPIFDPSRGFWQFLSRVTDLVGLSLCWLLCSLPLVTVCAATTALYDAVYHGVRRGELVVYGRFFSTFVRELKGGLLLALAALPVIALYYGLSYLSYVTEAGALVYAYQWVFCIPLAIWIFACATLSRFTFKTGALLATACQLVFAHLPSAILVAVPAALLLQLLPVLPILALFLPGPLVFLYTFPMERIFAPFLKGDGDEEQGGEEA